MLIVSFAVTLVGILKRLKDSEDLEKRRAFSIHKFGYHTYFGLSGTALSSNSEFDVDEGATKAKIKSAFAKSLKARR